MSCSLIRTGLGKFSQDYLPKTLWGDQQIAFDQTIVPKEEHHVPDPAVLHSRVQIFSYLVAEIPPPFPKQAARFQNLLSANMAAAIVP